jgi:hypothetical protein
MATLKMKLYVLNRLDITTSHQRFPFFQFVASLKALLLENTKKVEIDELLMVDAQEKPPRTKQELKRSL